MRYEPFDWFDAPDYYDIVYDPLAAEEARFVAAAFRKHGSTANRGARVLEPACGSGRVLAHLAEDGFVVSGFDASDAMVRQARVRLPRSTIHCQQMQSFAMPGSYDLVFNLLSTFKYLQSDHDAEAHLVRVADALVPGGLLLLGLHLSDYDQEHRTRERWTGERDGVHVVCNLQRWPPRRRGRSERARARLIVTRGTDQRRFESLWTFRCYDLRQLTRLLAREPRLQHVTTYGFDFDVDAPHEGSRRLDHVLVLRRR